MYHPTIIVPARRNAAFVPGKTTSLQCFVPLIPPSPWTPGICLSHRPSSRSILCALPHSAHTPLHGTAYTALTTSTTSQSPPPGMRIVCFEAPSQRSTWSPHGIDGFYVGPAMNHHRCFTVYIPSTHATRITGQLSWHPPPAYQLPGSTPADDVLSCISRLQASIEHLAQQHPHTHGTAQALGPSLPSLTLAIDHLSALLNPPSVDPVPALPPSQALAPAAALSQAPPRTSEGDHSNYTRCTTEGGRPT